MTLLAKSADLAARLFHGIGGRIGRFGSYAFLDARQAELGGVGPLDLEAVIRGYLAGGADFTFVQIGAHEGDAGDPLAACIRAWGLRGVLVEPQPGPFARLCENYADQPQLAFERAVIAPVDGTAAFYRVDPAFWARHGLPEGIDSQISSLWREQIRFHVALFGGKALAARESEYLIADDVPALTLSSLLAKHQIARPTLLQIDTEGFDFGVIKMIDWAQPPDLIHYETVHLPIPERKASWELLRAHGYRLFATNSYNTLAIRSGDSAASALPESLPSA